MKCIILIFAICLSFSFAGDGIAGCGGKAGLFSRARRPPIVQQTRQATVQVQAVPRLLQRLKIGCRR